MIKFRAPLFLVIFPLFPTLAIAGAWTQERGKYQLISTVNLYQADYYFDVNGKKQPQATFYKQELGQYGEYGLRDGLTIGGQLALARTFQASATGSSSMNLGDSELFVRARAWQFGSGVISLQPSLGIPSPDSKHTRPKIGSDGYHYGMRANAGYNFKLFGRSHYADASMGYIHRNGRAGDQLVLDATVGLSLTDRWQLMPQAFITRSTRNHAATAGFTQSASDDYDLNKLQVSTLYALNDRTKLQLGGYLNIAGRNTGNGHGVIVGVWRSL